MSLVVVAGKPLKTGKVYLLTKRGVMSKNYQKRKSIIFQVKERINAMDAMGQSKHAAKMEALHDNANGGHIDYGEKIYS